MTTINICALTCAQWDALLTTYNVRVIAPTSFADEPISLEDAWHHLRIDTFADPDSLDSPAPVISGDDYWLENIGIPAARNWAEGYVGRSLVHRRSSSTAPRSRRRISSCHSAVSISGLRDLLRRRRHRNRHGSGRIRTERGSVGRRVCQLAFGVDSWPTARDSYNSVRVRYIAGHTPPETVQALSLITPALKIGILLAMLGHL